MFVNVLQERASHADAKQKLSRIRPALGIAADTTYQLAERLSRPGHLQVAWALLAPIGPGQPALRQDVSRDGRPDVLGTDVRRQPQRSIQRKQLKLIMMGPPARRRWPGITD